MVLERFALNNIVAYYGFHRCWYLVVSEIGEPSCITVEDSMCDQGGDWASISCTVQL